MVGSVWVVFVRLKLRLIGNGLRGGWQRAAGLVVGIVFAIPLALSGFAILAAARSSQADRAAIAVIGFTGLFLGWMCFPVLGFGTDETLDPSRLTVFPLSRRDLMTGMLAASFVGIAPLATLLALTGGLVGYAPGSLGALVVVGALVVELCLCLTASRATITALARLLRTRRGRDITIVLVTLIAVLPQLVRVWIMSGHADTASVDLRPAVDVLRWTPPGLAGHAMVDAAAGRAAWALLQLLLAAACVVPLLLWWASSLERALTTAEVTQGPAKRTGPSRALFPRAVTGLLPWNRAGAVAAKELRYIGRDPRRRMQLLSGFLVPLFAFIPLLANHQLRSPKSVLGVTGFAFFLGLTALNQLGVDGRAYWMNVSAGNDPYDDLLGKNVAAALVTAAMLVFGAVALAAVAGGSAFLWLPLALALSAGVVGVQLGVGDVVSVRVPTPMPESPTNPWGQNTGQGCAAGFVGMLALGVEGLLLLPLAVLVAVGLGPWPPALVIAAPAAVVYGWLIWRTGLRIATRWLWWRLPELLETLTPP